MSKTIQLILMGKIFGTDGIRGRANTYPMTGELAFRVGQAAALQFKKDKDRIKIIIGKDTRLSGYIFEYALTSGLCSMGADVYLVGPMPTPAIAHLTRSFAADAGIVISASHNPPEDNGIKFFDSEGYKLADEIENQIEKNALKGSLDCQDVPAHSVGKAFRIDDAQGRYIEYVKNSIGNMSLKGLKIVLDCSNGAAYKVAPLILSELRADVITYGHKPDGSNINRECGALCPDVLKAAVLGNKADCGIALDGDADRVIMADEKGNVIDGDHILAMCALEMKKRGRLSGDTIVGTVMSNKAFELAMKDNSIGFVRTKVGDRYVIEEMRKNSYSLGGETSGHIIFSDHITTGDGTLAALQVLRIMKESGKRLSTLDKVFTSFPQIIENVRVRSKPELSSLPKVAKEIEKAESGLAKKGRVLVRYSGTENKCRVMVEGEDKDLIKRYADRIADKVREEIGERK